ncbi:16S rRNA (guanine(527)-N(7))-methyltransferase RsmG [Lactobacillus sp. LC28-10]|uniref:Ribosomal RNA small subunit methyltransferase G n=1 Tax=Secundilactobacillus angelensis TaxID=2722706 RepID=A0ABX1KXI1_9LACO|nr:16S rRNA (guanine(527)-N(7))-methyltransferase RsmG [Secundilactobacillus angelensis]MCH5461652.1 16S rRNA (guanine(527)-N(7))-methyltransferase RsmG [Secundilactobacillus angelensis]NLR17947.1 16S rRNA (guanine(527)-N(7))-methyltransferase RsmG [Secundilactobacillus angelensis]
MNDSQFIAALNAQGINVSDEQMQQFDQYFKILVETNQHLNLTTITERGDVYLKHFYDSVTPAFYAPELQTEELTLCDVGAGAGFPSLPMKILFPNLQVTIVDSLNKRINFLKDLIADLGLEGVKVYHARAEEFGGKRSEHREAYDVVTARAVARMSVLSELCLPLVKLNGQFIALKAQQTESELVHSKSAIATLGGKLHLDQSFTLPESGDERHIVVIDKVKPTPKRYPRKAGTPNKEPLGE